MKANRLLLATMMVGIHLTALAVAQTPPKPDSQMQAVLTQLETLNPQPIEKLSPEEARQQPTPADAVMALIKKKGMSAPAQAGSVKDTSVPGPAGEIPVRVYTPEGEGPFPIVVYIHGGGWVIATIDTYDASARAITNLAKAVVVAWNIEKRRSISFLPRTKTAMRSHST